MSWWAAAAALNAVVAIADLVIGISIARAVASTGRPWANPLAVAAGCLFLAGTAHHANLAAHLVADSEQLREGFVWHTVVPDVVLAGVAATYLGLRTRLPSSGRGAALFEDTRVRERQALEIHDNVVQGLAEAQMAFDVGRPQQARDAVDRTLAASRRLITELLGEPGAGIELRPGDLRRTTAADQPLGEQ